MNALFSAGRSLDHGPLFQAIGEAAHDFNISRVISWNSSESEVEP